MNAAPAVVPAFCLECGEKTFEVVPLVSGGQMCHVCGCHQVFSIPEIVAMGPAAEAGTILEGG